METVRFLRWVLHVDPERTRESYSQIATGGAEECGCEPCENFAAARGSVYPPEVLELFERLGVNPMLEAEVMHLCRLPNGLHQYAGWLHLVGQIAEGGECWREAGPDSRTQDLEPVAESFQLGFSSDRAVANDAFDALPVVAVEFNAEVPWVAETEEPT